MTPDSVELLPCPFCGGRAEMDTRQSFRAIVTGKLETAVAVYCADGPCSVQITLCRSDMPGLDDDDLIALATECWNRRAVPQQAGGEDVLCHRLHTSDGQKAWRWVDGAPNEQAKDDARNFGWTLELAYSAEAVAALRERALEMERQRDDYLNREWIATKAKQAAEAKLREAERDARRWRSFRKVTALTVSHMTPERWDAREDEHIAAAEADAYNIDAAMGEHDA